MSLLSCSLRVKSTRRRGPRVPRLGIQGPIGRLVHQSAPSGYKYDWVHLSPTRYSLPEDQGYMHTFLYQHVIVLSEFAGIVIENIRIS